MNGHTARKQANAVEDWRCEHVLWLGACKTFADIKDVSYDKNGKDSGFSGDQNEHSDAPGRGQFQRDRLLLQRDVGRDHSYFQSGLAYCLRSQIGRLHLSVEMSTNRY